MSMEESISLEETNKIRISLGLKPLTDDKTPANDKEKQAEQNYARQREQEAKDKEAKKLQERIAKVRNRHELNASLKGATLGDVDDDVDDVKKWAKRTKKREKEMAKKRQEELESMDKVFQGGEYTERDLDGLKVSHDFDALEDGEARILTLKDSRILDNEEDELQNVEMAEAERTKKNIELKTKRKDYKGYDDDEFVEGQQGVKRSILSKYDEDLEGAQETGFRLGSSVVSTKTKKIEELENGLGAVNKSLLSIDYAKNIDTHDYLQEGDIGFKKPKNKKKRSTRRVPEVEEPDAMEVDQKPIVRDLNVNFVDDDDLQAALARSRKAKLQKAKKLTPEELAQRILEQRQQEEAEEANHIKIEEDGMPLEDGEGTGLTFDETSEFVRSVGINPIPAIKETREVKVEDGRAPPKQRSESRDVSMAPGDEALDEIEAGEVVVKDEPDEDDMAMLDQIEEVLKAADLEDMNGAAADAELGTSTEQTFSAGMASTLSLLRQQGILATPSADQTDREKVQLQRDLWLADQRRRVAKRDLERLQSRGGNKDQAQREYENRLREQQDAREQLEAFKNYKPDVSITYYDEYGRELSMKEAWKALSHKFHGKGSGKMKTEKRLKKIADEKKKLAMDSGDTPLSMNKAFQQRQEKTGQAHFVLSVGNRGAVPQVTDFLDTQPLAKGKTEKTKKKKEAAANQAKVSTEQGFMTVPAPIVQTSSFTNGASPGPLGSGPGTSTSNSPAPRAGFSRISSVVEAPSQSSTPGPAASTGVKVAFGFGTKRKAGDDLSGTPPPKRR